MPIAVVVHSSIPTVRHGLLAMLRDEPDIESTEPNETIDHSIDLRANVDIIHVAGTGLSAEYEDVLERSSAAVLVLDGSPGDIPDMSGTPLALLPANSDADALAAATRAVASGLSVVDTELARSTGIGWRFPPSQSANQDDALTPREHEVIELVAQGLPNKAIAVALGISEHTVKFHMGSLMGKLGAESRTEAVTTATRRGILTI